MPGEYVEIEDITERAAVAEVIERLVPRASKAGILVYIPDADPQNKIIGQAIRIVTSIPAAAVAALPPSTTTFDVSVSALDITAVTTVFVKIATAGFTFLNGTASLPIEFDPDATDGFVPVTVKCTAAPVPAGPPVTLEFYAGSGGSNFIQNEVVIYTNSQVAASAVESASAVTRVRRLRVKKVQNQIATIQWRVDHRGTDTALSISYNKANPATYLRDAETGGDPPITVQTLGNLNGVFHVKNVSPVETSIMISVTGPNDTLATAKLVLVLEQVQSP